MIFFIVPPLLIKKLYHISLSFQVNETGIALFQFFGCGYAESSLRAAHAPVGAPVVNKNRTWWAHLQVRRLKKRPIS
jgi:hypothetical protein